MIENTNHNGLLVMKCSSNILKTLSQFYICGDRITNPSQIIKENDYQLNMRDEAFLPHKTSSVLPKLMNQPSDYNHL